MSRLLARTFVGFVLLLGGCTQGAEEPGPLTFANTPPIRLAVQSIEIQEERPFTGGNFIDKRRSENLASAVKEFLRARLQAGGGEDWGKVVIEEASLVERPREVQGGITGALTREPSRELLGSLTARVAIVDGLGIEKAYAKAHVEMKRSVLEGTKFEERDRVARLLMRDLIETLSRSLQTSIDENLANYRAL
jgi:hypothetical protein